MHERLTKEQTDRLWFLTRAAAAAGGRRYLPQAELVELRQLGRQKAEQWKESARLDAPGRVRKSRKGTRMSALIVKAVLLGGRAHLPANELEELRALDREHKKRLLQSPEARARVRELARRRHAARLTKPGARERRREQNKAWLAKKIKSAEPETVRKRAREYTRLRRQLDPAYRLAWNLRGRVRYVVAQHKKGKSVTQLVDCGLGCSYTELCRHLEMLFLPGMTWENYGDWEVDHKIPISAANLLVPEEAGTVLHYTNLQPLWKADNRKKGACTDWKPPQVAQTANH